ncbi:hypothetical protein HDU83_001307 [Entophlyctis luteolus]|nr:hypothetical protein HDU83_001307 [Entophlyctis luteolus]KAJ3388383.1 hypothetical protein HDU84_009817 [Entophlyctis sp. JEL0112]
MSANRAKQTIAVWETESRTAKRFAKQATANGHTVVALKADVDFAGNKHFQSAGGSVDALLANATSVVVAGGAENHAAAASAVASLVAAISAGKAPKLKSIFFVSTNGAKASASYFSRSLYRELAAAEKLLVDLADFNPNISYTIFRPPVLVDTEKMNDVFVFDESARGKLPSLSNQVSYLGLGDAILEIVETQPRFRNKIAAVNSNTVLVENYRGGDESRKIAWHAFVTTSPYLLIAAAAVVAGIYVAKRQQQH